MSAHQKVYDTPPIFDFSPTHPIKYFRNHRLNQHQGTMSNNLAAWVSGWQLPPSLRSAASHPQPQQVFEQPVTKWPWWHHRSSFVLPGRWPVTAARKSLTAIMQLETSSKCREEKKNSSQRWCFCSASIPSSQRSSLKDALDAKIVRETLPALPKSLSCWQQAASPVTRVFTAGVKTSKKWKKCDHRIMIP